MHVKSAAYAPMEHSAVHLTCIKLPYSFKTFVLSSFKCLLKTGLTVVFIPRRSRRDIVLAASVRTFCLSGTISQYLLVRFNSFLVQMISTMNSRYPISLVKIDPLTLELLPLFKYRQL